MKYRRIAAVPGQTILELTEEWAGLSAGTEVRPMSVGHNNRTHRDERTVVVLSGPRAGETVTASDD